MPDQGVSDDRFLDVKGQLVDEGKFVESGAQQVQMTSNSGA